jgi:hypothetical protein
LFGSNQDTILQFQPNKKKERKKEKERKEKKKLFLSIL